MKNHFGHENNIHTTSFNDLVDYLDPSGKEQAHMHWQGTSHSLAANSVRFFDGESEFLRREGKIEANPIQLLGDAAVKSVLLHHTMMETIDTIPTSQHVWKVKTRESTDSSSIRFFVAKASVGSINAGGTEADIIERRTFAAIGHNAVLAREIDIHHLLGSARRHERDDRRIIVAPTSLSLYALKNAE